MNKSIVIFGVLWIVSFVTLDHYYNKMLNQFYVFVVEVVLPTYCK